MTFLFNHQKNILADWPKKTGLFLGTGSGKTRIALMLAAGRTLVIAPKTQVEDKNWQRELDILIEKRPDKWKKATNIENLTTISKEIFRRDWESLPEFDTVIVDEAHACLGVTPNTCWINKKEIPKTSQLFETLHLYIQKTHPKRIYLCTATILRSPMTVWGAAVILGKVNPHELMESFLKFRKRYYIRLPMPGREVWTVKKDSATKDLLAKAVKKLGYVGQLSDYFDVPQQTFKIDYIELTREQKIEIKNLELEYPDPIVLIGKQHQVEQGILNGDQFNKPRFFSNNKLDKIIDYAIEFPKLIIFAKYTLQIEQIQQALRGLGKRIFVLTGDTKDRGQLFADAKITQNYVFIAQSQISSGWELPDCPVMIFASLDWSVVSYIQAQGRILRTNHLKKNLYIHLVTKNAVDEHVYKAIMDKRDFHERIFLNYEKQGYDR